MERITIYKCAHQTLWQFLALVFWASLPASSHKELAVRGAESPGGHRVAGRRVDVKLFWLMARLPFAAKKKKNDWDIILSSP